MQNFTNWVRLALGVSDEEGDEVTNEENEKAKLEEEKKKEEKKRLEEEKRKEELLKKEKEKRKRKEEKEARERKKQAEADRKRKEKEAAEKATRKRQAEEDLNRRKKSRKRVFHFMARAVLECYLSKKRPKMATRYTRLDALAETTTEFTESNAEIAVVMQIKTHEPWKFLTGCLERIEKLKDMSKRKKEKYKQAEKDGVVSKEGAVENRKKVDEEFAAFVVLRTLVLRYMGLLLFEAGSFVGTQSKKPINEFVNALLSEKDKDKNFDLLMEMYGASGKDQGKRIFEAVFLGIRDVMKGMDFLNKKFMDPLVLLKRIVEKKDLRKILVEHPAFLPDDMRKNGRKIEFQTILGPFFRITCIEKKVGQHLFRGVRTLSTAQLQGIYDTIRAQFSPYYDTLHAIMFALFKDKETRDELFDFLSSVIEANEAKGKVMEVGAQSCSDGFIINFGVVMLRMCRPIFSQLDTVSKVRYEFALSPPGVSINFSDETKLAMPIADAKKIKIEGYKDNNRDRLFFFTYKTLHLAHVNCLRRYQQTFESVLRVRERYKHFKRVAPNRPETVHLENQFYAMTVAKWEYAVHILEKTVNYDIVGFFNCASSFLKRMMNPEGGDKFFLTEAPPQQYACLPEYFVTDIIDHLKLIMRHAKLIVKESSSLGVVVDLLLLILGNRQYLSNPNERSKISEILLLFAPSPRVNDHLTRALTNNGMANKYLMRCLMDLYIDVESMDNSYVLKHKPRFEISILIKVLWHYPIFVSSFESECVLTSKRFLLFFNMMLNDATYLLDESLHALKEIHEHELRTKNLNVWNKTPTQERNELTENNVRTRQMVTQNMQLANSTVGLFKTITERIQSPFLREELMPRLAEMLNFFLSQLTNDAKNYSVTKKKELNFDPKLLLSEIMDIFVNFSKYELFHRAVASDERSFNPIVFEKAIALLIKFKNRSTSYLEQVQMFVLDVLKMRKIVQEEEGDLGDIPVPDEFLGQIMYSLMKDPVKLPSGNIVDRIVITRRLLDKQEDPFTRQPLTTEMLTPLPELKEKIEAWVQKRKEENKKLKLKEAFEKMKK